MNRFLKIRNWEKFQHYKFRNPSWVKLHVQILQSEDWVTLDDASRLLALICLMLAAKHNGHISLTASTEAYIKRIAYLDHSPNLKPLIDCGFLIEVLADASVLQASAPKCLNRVQSTEKEKKDYAPLAQVSAAKKGETEKDPLFAEFYLSYPRKKSKRAAAKAYASARQLVPHDAIMAGLARAKRGWSDPKFIPYPASWLNAGGYDDEPTLVRNGPDDPFAGIS
jgi:hypothetical protein